MSDKRVTTRETEADLEARVRAAIKVAFPWLPDGAIKHQIKFVFKFGRKSIEVDSSKLRNEAKLDILLEMDNVPLAVLELKRPGIALTSDDGAQGMSYARLVDPPAPLVVVTNGTEVTFYETHTGKLWEPEEKSDKAFKALVTQASRVAGADLRHAIDTLMGTSPEVWMAAVRVVSIENIEELTASWDKPALPFIKNFLAPRGATAQLIRRLDAGVKILVLEGPPLAGKSNVLRELQLRSQSSETTAVLFVEAGTGHGAMQALADSLGRSLDWPVTTQEARDWLRRVSNAEGARLVLAFDGLQISDLASLKEIEDLSSSAFGPSLSVVVTMDETVSHRLRTTPNGRASSPLGRRSEVVAVSQLLDNEFSAARKLLSRHGVFMMTGAEMAPEYRQPWVLRAMGSYAEDALKNQPNEKALTLPPMLGLTLLELIRKRFKGDPDLRRRFRGLARAVVTDAQDASRPPDLVLQLFETGIVRRQTVLTELESSDLDWLVDYGYVRPAMHDVAGPTILVRFPELLASEIAYVLADELSSRAQKDAKAAAAWIAGAASNLPLGEVVVAQAILDASGRPNGLPVAVISYLVHTPPSEETIEVGKTYAMMLPDGDTVDINFDADNKGFLVIDGVRHEIELSDQEAVYKDMAPWMILSHAASVPFEVEFEEGPERQDPVLLLQVGSCPIPLRASRGAEQMRLIPTVDFAGVSVLHHSAGIVEPITLGILNYLSQEDEEVDEWIDNATASGSIALLSRIHTALHVLAAFQTHSRSAWADAKIDTVVAPKLSEAIEAAAGSEEDTAAK